MRILEKFDVKEKSKTVKFFGDDSYNNVYPFSYTNFDISSSLIDNPENYFLIRVKGDSMIGSGIQSGDILLVHKTSDAKQGDIVVAEINSKLAVKKLKIDKNLIYLVSENPNYIPILVNKNDNFKIWGVVRSVIKSV